MKKSIDTIRGLAIDAIAEANSGHPGIALGSAPIIYSLYKNHLNINPEDLNWIGRDRFVLSAGHGSSMLYAINSLLGYGLEVEDLRNFRQINSNTPGHPELGLAGAECSTGPLGQGIAMGVGLAYAQQKLHNRFPGLNNYTYVLCGDGDLMEGISYEAASFAGLNKLSKLIVLYDSNDVSLDGPLSLSFNESIEQRFTAQGWDYILVSDPSEENVSEAIKKAKTNDRPTLIEVKTIIGEGSLGAGTAQVHGAPLAHDDKKQLFEKYNHQSFTVPPEVHADFNEIKQRMRAYYDLWTKENKDIDYEKELAKKEIVLDLKSQPEATRVSGSRALKKIAASDENLLVGSADLSSSNQTAVDNEAQNIYFGVREFAMAAMANGISLYAKTPIYVSTFMVFSDYLKPAMRLSALMSQPVKYIFTHDSIYVGEDGPTHQPIEQLAMLRGIPGTLTFRPADALEVAAVYEYTYQLDNQPCAICLTRQELTPVCQNMEMARSGVRRGAYRIYGDKKAERTIFCSGSEVSLAINIAKEMGNTDVVSVVSQELFFQQDPQYISNLVGNKKNNYVLEFAGKSPWMKVVEDDQNVIGIEEFGFSAKPVDVVKKLQLTKEDIIKRIYE